ncbi:MAG TPA: FAD-dependent oxidoreductase [Methanospirillum sp.]|jgi:alkyl hydroperoxide reductase subunit F|uniref:FAD-dependent oxidoreductase n=1 Tax=Methanospirillum sp. TaxID=45200 RepID=UPI0009C7BEBD|nr:FAD-dependent oxidoreductase [Methanospirillum sp.]NLL10008.1 FAD-dependent oxidoreductase [Methanomicrobiales archaeon]OQB39051.1 MAG: Sulfide dehydrogenase subunit alpha precursor [Euryarchaeota archaeon ADurb.Bin165]HPY59606.1 FAD-dependent oxidoreductase [Methanospirillum sp.]
MSEVTVYSTQNCPYCRLAKAFLDRNNVPYRSVDVGIDRKAAKEMVELSGQYGVPVIVAGDEVIIGFDTDRLRALFTADVKTDIYDTIIVGAGPAGLTAALYCARKNLKTLMISPDVGGQALESWNIENYMGYRMITGDDLMAKFEEQLKELEIRIELDQVSSLLPTSGGFSIKTVSDLEYKGKTVILTQGKKPRKLGIPREKEFTGRGLSVCATCDGPIFKDKVVGVIGGGNSALTTAIEMSGIAKEVHLFVRSSIRADAVYTSRFTKKQNIITHIGYEVTELIGEDRLSGVSITNRETGEKKEISLDGLFTEIGWIPNTSFVDGLLVLNDQKEIVVDIDCKTSAPGIFAAGDVTSISGKQIIIACGEGAKAALSAFDYLMTN